MADASNNTLTPEMKLGISCMVLVIVGIILAIVGIKMASQSSGTPIPSAAEGLVGNVYAVSGNNGTVSCNDWCSKSGLICAGGMYDMAGTSYGCTSGGADVAGGATICLCAKNPY